LLQQKEVNHVSLEQPVKQTFFETPKIFSVNYFPKHSLHNSSPPISGKLILCLISCYQI
jgi:hypothetical protein